MATDINFVRGASYKEIPFLMDRSQIQGGRKFVINSYVNSDRQNIDDLGLQPRSVNLTAIITGDNYEIDRDRLLGVLEESGNGTLVHPLYGNMETMKAVSFSLDEDFSSFGEARFQIQFEKDEPNAFANEAGVSPSQVFDLAGSVRGALKNGIANLFGVSPNNVLSISAAISKVNGFVTMVNDEIKSFGGVLTEINAINNELNNLSANVTDLILAPARLAQSIDDIMTTVNNLFESPEQALDVVRNAFGFGDDDPERLQVSTFTQDEINSNNDVINVAVNAYLLTSCYESLVESDFATIDQLEYLERVLEEQYDSIINVGVVREATTSAPAIEALDRDSKALLTELRTVTSNVISESKTTLPDVVEEEILYTAPLRVIEYAYYENNNQTAELRSINDIPNECFYTGRINLLNDPASS